MELHNASGLASWVAAVPLMQAGYHLELLEEVADLRRQHTIYPPQSQILRALELTSFEATAVVIVGQDPYHRPGQAHGLAFSVPHGVRLPPSLRNILREVAQDCYDGKATALDPDLTRWAVQGVLLLNALLTVEEGRPGSHRALGWEKLTDAIISQLSARRDHLVFMLWGRYAQAKSTLVDPTQHLILQASHPSPLSAHLGFLGCRHFSRANAYLKAHGKRPITW